MFGIGNYPDIVYVIIRSEEEEMRTNVREIKTDDNNNNKLTRKN
jgi:hypothetical protein